MKFGKVDDPSTIDFTLPPDHSSVVEFLKPYKSDQLPAVYIGCAKWNKKDLINFYPRGTKDELVYYSEQFNAIELNATYFRNFKPEQVLKWKNRTSDDFRFFPKVNQNISQYKKLKNAEESLDYFLSGMHAFGEKLGIIFLQMHHSYGPKHFETLKAFIESWPIDVRLALELRHLDWYNDEKIAEPLFELLTAHKVTHVITDTPGKRDLIKMRFTTPYTFVRYNGANHPTDADRIDDWFDRLKKWIELGVQEINFFVHQNHEEASPFLSKKLIKRLNNELGFNLRVPNLLSE